MLPELPQLLDRALDSRFRSVVGLVVLRRRCVVYERYARGHGPGDPHNVASVAKSVTSALIGIAIASGRIESVDAPVLDFFPEYAPGSDRVPAVTVRHLLTMTAPFVLKARGTRSEPLDRLRRQPDWVEYCVGLLDGSGAPGTFQYGSAGFHLLSAILTRATGRSAREYANERLFGPIGIPEIPRPPMGCFGRDEVFGNASGWSSDPTGHSAGGWGLALSPRDMARFGLLYLGRGAWEGRQVLPETWVEESTAPNPNGYGYGWWLAGAGSTFTFSAAGAGGSHVYCTPGKQLVVAIASRVSPRPPDRRWLLERCILPSVVD
jgi:CubicO group peptidase (beta-lactamase class C family)